jgi:hypothetical protein
VQIGGDDRDRVIEKTEIKKKMKMWIFEVSNSLQRLFLESFLFKLTCPFVRLYGCL